MNLYSLFLIAIALSLDAFGVALCIGLNGNLKFKNKLLFAASFGFFQFLFSLLGAYGGFLFNKYITTVPQMIGGLIMTFVGIFMIKEGMTKGECPLIKPGMYIVLGVSVSIDALVVGFTAMEQISSSMTLINNTLFIGIVTFIISVAAFFVARYLKKIEVVGKYADYLGGIILILFGLKMMFF